MRKLFVTGLIILLPLALTLAIVIFILNFFTAPFVILFRNTLYHFGVFNNGLLFFNGEEARYIVSQILVLIFLFFFTVLLGYLTRWVFMHYIIKFGDYVFHRIPVVRTIYKTSQDLIKTIFSDEKSSFKKVVLVPFFNSTAKGIGFVTQEKVGIHHGAVGVSYISVFVPTTPNPTSGFILLYREEELIYLDISVEEAFKYIISCGVTDTPLQNHQALEKL